MAMISLRQLLDHAAEHGYGVPAFNVNKLETFCQSQAGQRHRQVVRVHKLNYFYMKLINCKNAHN